MARKWGWFSYFIVLFTVSCLIPILLRTGPGVRSTEKTSFEAGPSRIEIRISGSMVFHPEKVVVLVQDENRKTWSVYFIR